MTKSNYTPDQWQLLLDVPPAVGTAVMVAGRSGLGSVKEAMAMARGILGAREGYDGNALVEALVEARLKDGEKSSIESLSSPYRNLSPDQVLDDAVERCEAVAGLLADKASESDASGYKQWALSVGQKVAEAAKEGGFLGVGGERVSEDERHALARLKQALCG